LINRNESKIRQLEAQGQKLADDLKLRDLELKTASDKLAEETKGKGEVEKVLITSHHHFHRTALILLLLFLFKAQKALKTQVAELKESLEKEQLLRKKAEASRDEVQSQAKALQV
jgi:3-dehydroquinate dehydratase